MEDELVRRRQWLPRERFLDLLGASNLIPGPSSSELAIHIGYLLAGWRGLLDGWNVFHSSGSNYGSGPRMAYVHFGKLPEFLRILMESSQSSLQSFSRLSWDLGRTAVKTTLLGIVGALSVLLAFFGLHPLLLLLLAGGAVCLTSLRTSRLSITAVSLLQRSDGGFGRRSNFVQFGFALSGFFKSGGGRVRKRLRFVGIPSCGSRCASRLADGLATCRCCRGGAGDSRASIHDCYFRWLPARWNSRRGSCNSRHLSSCISSGSGKRSSGAAYSKIQTCGGFP